MYILEGLLFTGLFFLSGITLVLLRNRFQFRGFRFVSSKTENLTARVAICIPARNEELNIFRCLDHALAQTYANTTVYVLDDRSGDSTGAILERYKKNYGERMQILSGREKPDDWLGKPNACAQLAHKAGKEDLNDILIFADADTWLHARTAARAASLFSHEPLDFFTIWPEQRTGSWWENAVIPLVYYALLGLLPVRYTERKPRWMPAFFHKRYKDLFAAACGQFMAFRRSAYEAIGGHESVKNEIVEDVMLARRVLRAGLRMRMYHGVGAVFCRMYTSQKEMYEGFRKNFLAGFNYNIPLFLMMAVLHIITFLLPVGTLIYALFEPGLIPERLLWLSGGLIVLTLLHRLILAMWMNWPKRHIFTHVIAVAWFQRLGLVTLWDFITKREVSWKGERIKRQK